MIFYHGTSRQNALNICKVGFIPKKGGKVWFAHQKKLAIEMAYMRSRSRKVRPVVLTCEIDIDDMCQRYGKHRVHYRGGVLTIAGSVPPTVLRNPPSDISSTSPVEREGGSVLKQHSAHMIPSASPKAVTAWVNHMFRRKSYNGVGQNHPGIRRLVGWMKKRMAAHTGTNKITIEEFIGKIRQWLPDLCREADLDPRISRLVEKDTKT